jgi:hypothetical protein
MIEIINISPSPDYFTLLLFSEEFSELRLSQIACEARATMGDSGNKLERRRDCCAQRNNDFFKCIAFTFDTVFSSTFRKRFDNRKWFHSLGLAFLYLIVSLHT